MNHTKPAKTKCGHRIYQLDCEAYDRLVDHAGNQCQICGVGPEQTKHGFLVVDHDARVGQWAVRGLLCSTCNTALPAGSTPTWAADYLVSPWWQRELERLGLSAEQPPEPGIGSVVLTPNRDTWRRGPKGWQQTANWRHKPTLSWDRLNYRFGPHQIRVLSGRPAVSEEQIASEPMIRRRSLPHTLRWLAEKMNEPLSDAERAGVALVLNSLAHEAEQPAGLAGSKPDLLQALADALTALAEAGEEPELEYDHINCESGTVWWGNPLWTAKLLPGVQQPSAGPVRPDEETTT